MSTNPNNAVGTNAAYSGRTSAKAFNDAVCGYSAGILSGWACTPSTGLTVALGGDGTTRDVAIAENNTGDKITVNNISGLPIDVTIGAAPATNSRIDLIVAYVENPPQGSASQPDNPSACGIIAVAGTASASPVPPSEANIRSAITADGGSGTTAYYVVLADITIASGTTDLTASNITQTNYAQIGSQQIAEGAVKADNIDFTTLELYTTEQRNFPVTTTDTAIATYTTPNAGKYLVLADCNFHTVGSQHSVYLTLSQNNTEIDNSYVGIQSNYWGALSYSQIVDCAVGDVIQIGLRDTVGIPASTNTRARIHIIQLRTA